MSSLHVYILDTYLNKLQKVMNRTYSTFARYQKSKLIQPYPVPVGKPHTSEQSEYYVQTSGGNKTNRSLRATSATQMYNSEIPEKLV